MIVVSVFDVECYLPHEQRMGHIRLTNGGGVKTLSHFAGFSCTVYVDQKFNLMINIEKTSYANITECMNIRLVDVPDKKMYNFDPLVKSENTEGELLHSRLNLKYQDIKRDELEHTLKNTPNGVLCLHIFDNKDLYVGINGDMYIFKNISSRNGLHVDENRLKTILPILLAADLNTNDYESKAQRILAERKYIDSVNELTIIKEAMSRADEIIAFGKCIVAQRNNSHIAPCGIPDECEHYALDLTLFGYGDKVDEMIAGFKKTMNPESTK